jgi:hypothetical protein
MARAFSGAAPTSGTVTFNNKDNFAPPILPAMQVEGNPQKDCNSHDDIYCIHFSAFLYDYLFMQTDREEKYFTGTSEKTNLCVTLRLQYVFNPSSG